MMKYAEFLTLRMILTQHFDDERIPLASGAATSGVLT